MEAVLTGPAGRTLLGSSEVTIGCGADNSLIITDLRASVHHAVVRPDGLGSEISSLLSRLQAGQTPTYTSQPWVPDGATTYPPQQQLWQLDRRRLYLRMQAPRTTRIARL